MGLKADLAKGLTEAGAKAVEKAGDKVSSVASGVEGYLRDRAAEGVPFGLAADLKQERPEKDKEQK